MSANLATRCHRCDEALKPKHKCPHGRRCDVDKPCAECVAFKERQEKLFVDPPLKPFLKWAGGKRKLAKHIIATAPEKFGRYFEPFAGAGAVFFALRPARATLGDTNSRLMRCFAAVRDDIDRVMELLRSYPVDKDFYMSFRKKEFDEHSEDYEVAAWLLYVNRTGFNGLYRVNNSGVFNIPWGQYKNPTVCDEKTLRACSSALGDAALCDTSFERTVARAEAGDLIYFDPPYVPTSESADFTKYTRDGFTLNDQVKLRDAAVELAQRGVHVLLTNSNTKTVRELYDKDRFDIKRVAARGSIAANAESRGKRIDLLMIAK